MSEELTPEKVSSLLEHWIEHNEQHTESFNNWTLKIKEAGYTDVAKDVLLAAEKMNESTRYLEKAKNNLPR